MATNLPRRGGRPRSGTLEPAGTWPSGKPRFRGRVRLADGTRSERFDAPERMSEADARKWLAGIQAEEDARGLLLEKKREAARALAAERLEPCEGETCDAWYARRPARIEDRGRWRRWISPHIGPKAMVRVTRADVEAVRDALDVAIREGRAAPKTALGAWCTLTSSFRLASAGKDRSLRILEQNPCIGVLPPDSGDGRRRSWLYPSEAARLLACDAVPLEARRLYALALYLYLRPGELAALEWRDVDLVANVVRVTKALDSTTGETKAPKTRNGIRTVPIPATLRPLLEQMHDEARGETDKPTGHLVPAFHRQYVHGATHGAAKAFRAHLRAAGVDREELYTLTKTTEPIDFRTCRDSGITWLALAGVDVVKMQRRAGHDSLETTMRYVKVAEDFSGTVGEPFPPLPAGFGPSDGPAIITNPAIFAVMGRRAWDSNPRYRSRYT